MLVVEKVPDLVWPKRCGWYGCKTQLRIGLRWIEWSFQWMATSRYCHNHLALCEWTVPHDYQWCKSASRACTHTDWCKREGYTCWKHLGGIADNFLSSTDRFHYKCDLHILSISFPNGSTWEITRQDQTSLLMFCLRVYRFGFNLCNSWSIHACISGTGSEPACTCNNNTAQGDLS